MPGGFHESQTDISLQSKMAKHLPTRQAGKLPISEFALTIRHDEIVDEVYLKISVAWAVPNVVGEASAGEAKALWDTGATHSCISERLAHKLGLEAVDYVHVATASGIEYVPTYFTHLFFPNGLEFRNWELMQFKYSGDDSDLKIGMDIITQGDFSITNFGGKTYCSFRIPSKHALDYEG